VNTDSTTISIDLTDTQAKALRSILRLVSADARDTIENGAGASAYMRAKQEMAVASHVIGQINGGRS